MAAACISERFDSLGSDTQAEVRLGIMGGSFDPIHFGHLLAAERSREAYKLDAVIFMPAGVPSFKRERELAPTGDRLAMCKLAVADNPAFDVSSIELDREGVTYSVDTMRVLREHYPDNVRFYFITGTDAIRSLPSWYGAEELAGLTRFVAVTRPGEMLSDDERSAIAALGAPVFHLEIPALAISSSDLRERVRASKSIRYLTSEAVCAYIASKKLYTGE